MQIALRDYFSVPVVTTFNGFIDSCTNIALVECMGRLFAVIPTLPDLHKTVEKETMKVERIVVEDGIKTYNDYGYLLTRYL